MNPTSAALAHRLGTVALTAVAIAAAGCTTTTDSLFSGEKVDYRSAASKTRTLEVPPDLTQLGRESRYLPQGGVVSASTVAAPAAGAAAVTAVPATVAVTASGDVQLERQGQQRWLVSSQTPEQLWPRIRTFWEQRGFTIAVENPAAGFMETNWSENRAKLPDDAVRNMLGSLLNSLYDTGERDRFRTRLERTPTGTEIYVSHRGIAEMLVGERRESTTWQARPNDPQLEAEMLTRMMVALGARESATRQARADAAAPTAAAGAGSGEPARARMQAGPGVSLVVDEPFDRAWRRVGLALDRGGFTVEDRDRAAGVYFVRYIDPKIAGRDGPGFFSRLFGRDDNPQAATRYRVSLQRSGDTRTAVSVLTSSGEQQVGDNGQRIASLLLDELR